MDQTSTPSVIMAQHIEVMRLRAVWLAFESGPYRAEMESDVPISDEMQAQWDAMENAWWNASHALHDMPAQSIHDAIIKMWHGADCHGFLEPIHREAPEPNKLVRAFSELLALFGIDSTGLDQEKTPTFAPAGQSAELLASRPEAHRVALGYRGSADEEDARHLAFCQLYDDPIEDNPAPTLFGALHRLYLGCLKDLQTVQVGAFLDLERLIGLPIDQPDRVGEPWE
jgi:hypothetical protein